MTIILLVSWIAFGFIVGILARAIYPGANPMGFFPTTALGVVGSFAGGLIGNALVGAPLVALHGAGLVGSVVGALVIMAVLGMRQPVSA